VNVKNYLQAAKETAILIGAQRVNVNITGVNQEMILSDYLVKEAKIVAGLIMTSTVSMIKNNGLQTISLKKDKENAVINK
jgi:hypothetical protein